MNESNFYKKIIKPMLKKSGVFFCRIDYHGIPDVYIAKNNRVFWIELKCVNGLRKDTISPGWRPGQLSWIRENSFFGNENIYLGLYYQANTYFLKPKEFYTMEDLNNQINILEIINGI